MHGAAISLARQFLTLTDMPDLILATDMLDLGVFLGLLRHRISDIPIVLYFHENQLTYPWSPVDQDPGLNRDRHYAFINYTSALAADHVCFNSHFHQQAFLEALPGFLQAFPDHQEIDLVHSIEQKSQVLPLGLNLKALDAARSTVPASKKQAPLILWNHRWEYDKNPETFFAILQKLSREGFAFRLAVVGESFGRRPAIFSKAKKDLHQHIVHWGYMEDGETYARLLWEADILPGTAKHDFFGVSVVQAIYCECYPLLPHRLAYPSHIPNPLHDQHLYADDAMLMAQLKQVLRQDKILPSPMLKKHIKQYDWSHLVHEYDELWEGICSTH